MTTVTVVTPWQNHPELADEYWKAIHVAGQHVDVIVVDNGSDPPLPNAIRLDYNSGFSHASNLGLQLARTDAVLFLNNDIFATQEGWLLPILDALEPGVLVSPVIRYDEHGMVDGMPLPYADGWCLAGMRADLLELGGFDEDYQEPSYFGDNDLSFRARLNGMVLREAPTGIAHLASKTSGGVEGPGVKAAYQANYRRFASMVRDVLSPIGA